MKKNWRQRKKEREEHQRCCKRMRVDDDSSVDWINTHVARVVPVATQESPIDSNNSTMVGDPEIGFTCNQEAEDRDLFTVENEDEAVVLTCEPDPSFDNDSFGESNILIDEDPLWHGNISESLPISLYSLYTLLLFFIVKHCLSKSGIEDLLQLVSLFIPDKKLLGTTKYRFFKALGFKSGMTKFYFCNSCNVISGRNKTKCAECKKNQDFILWRDPMVHFSSRLAEKDFYHKVQYRYEKRGSHIRRFRTTGRIKDVYEGSVYIRVADPYTKNKHSYSFLFNYDGATKWKSSLVSAIPMYLVCNEMKLSERFKVENIIFCGVWFGKEKPDTNVLFTLLVKSFNESHMGAPAVDPQNAPITVKGILLQSSCDVPAQHDMMKLVHHGGTCSCFACNHSGVKVDNKRFCYPLLQEYKGKKFDIKYRTEKDINDIYEEIKKRSQESTVPIFNGLKSIPLFNMLPYWKWTNFGTIDFMHLLEGVFRAQINVWTQAKYSTTGRALISKAKWLKWEEQYLLKQSIPEMFGRNIRSVYSNYKYFKAQECLIFILYTSRLLKYVLPDEHFKNHMLLVDGMYTLLGGDLNDDELVQVQAKLFDYVKGFQTLYGYDRVTYNIHLLIHVGWCYKRHGPLICYSAFPFESFNKIVLSGIHGTYRVEKGLSEAIPLYQFLDRRMSEVKDDTTRKVLQRMKSKKMVISNKIQVPTTSNDDRGVFVYGQDKQKSSSTRDFNQTVFKYARIDGRLVESRAHVRQRTFQNSFVRFKDRSIGMIHKIYKQQEGDEERWMVTVQNVHNKRLITMSSKDLREINNLLIVFIVDDLVECVMDVLDWHAITLR